MQVDRAEFLRLAVLLASASCGERGAPVSRMSSGQVADRSPELTLSSSVATRTCSNENGSTVDACSRVGPTCEGLDTECKSLGESLRPRVAERWAVCFAKASGHGCRDKALGECMRAAIDSACIEPDAITTCNGIMQACSDDGTPAKYTLDTCAKVVSAVLPVDPGNWHAIDIERMGPGETKHHCSLEHVLPYQPYGWMWR